VPACARVLVQERAFVCAMFVCVFVCGGVWLCVRECVWLCVVGSHLFTGPFHVPAIISEHFCSALLLAAHGRVCARVNAYAAV